MIIRNRDGFLVSIYNMLIHFNNQLIIETEKVFSKKTVKLITDFDAKHLEGGGFRENTFDVFSTKLEPIPLILSATEAGQACIIV